MIPIHILTGFPMKFDKLSQNVFERAKSQDPLEEQDGRITSPDI